MLRSLRTAALTLLASLLLSSPALAASAGADPSSNHPAGTVPDACRAPTSAACIAASVAILDQARSSLGQPAYAVPSNFATLTGAEQGFVLANLDRLQYGLPPMTGLTAALNSDAAAGVQNDADPQPAAANYLAWTANWAGGFTNMPLAYEAWMYDDGPGSGNLDCASTTTSGCWGHRHDVLYRFDPSGGPLAMGAAQGTDPSNEAGYTMLLFQGDSSFHPNYVYTWAQAVSAGTGTSSGAGTGPGAAHVTGDAGRGHGAAGPGTQPATVTISVHVHRHRVRIIASVPSVECALTPRRAHRWAHDHYRTCPASLPLAGHRPGRYRLRIRAAGLVVTRYIRVP
jgi:hypothetical protein